MVADSSQTYSRQYEYVNAGGAWTDAPVSAPVAAGVRATAAVCAVTTNLGTAVWTGFRAFALDVVVAAVTVQFAAGDRQGAD